MFQALKQGLGGHNLNAGEQALDDVRSIKYENGLVTTTLRRMDALFAIIAEHKLAMPESEKLRILQSAFRSNETYRPIVKFGRYTTYFDLCVLLQQDEAERAKSICQSTTSTPQVAAYVAESTDRSSPRRKVVAFHGTCHFCGEVGHKADRCPRNTTEESCQLCGKTGLCG